MKIPTKYGVCAYCRGISSENMWAIIVLRMQALMIAYRRVLFQGIYKLFDGELALFARSHVFQCHCAIGNFAFTHHGNVWNLFGVGIAHLLFHLR